MTAIGSQVPRNDAEGANSDAAARDPLKPTENPGRLLGWLRSGTRSRSRRAVPVWLRALFAIVVTVGLGIWGYSELALAPKLDFAERVYRAIRLYTLDLGPASGGKVHPNWQLWVALILAALLVLRALLALGRERLRRVATRYALRGHVIVCGGGVHGTALVTALAGGRGPGEPGELQHEVVLVDSDPQSPGMQSPPARFEWRLVADATREETLLSAGIARAHWIVANTGNDFVNCQIVSTVRALAKKNKVRDRLHVMVQVEDPSLARFLEEETELPHAGTDHRVPVVSPFSANAIAAEALVYRSQIKLASGERAPLLRMHDGQAPNLLLVGDHPLIDAVILNVLRAWRVRILREFEQRSDRHRRMFGTDAVEQRSDNRRPPLHVSVFGPDAVARVEQLRRRWRPESHVLTLDALDSELIAEGPGSSEIWQRKTHEWLREPHRADHAVVVCLEELDGVKRTLHLSRLLSEHVLITRVTTQAESVLDEHIKDRLASTDVESIAELACKPDEMARLGAEQRLTHVLDKASKMSEQEARKLSAELFARPALDLHSDSTWRVLPNEQPLLEPLVDPVPVSALLRAGLTVNLASTPNLRFVAQRLSRTGDESTAFAAWCEYARRLDSESLPAALTLLEELPPQGLGAMVLRLRAFTLGERGFVGEPAREHSLAGTPRVAIFAGGAKSMSAEAATELDPLLERALTGYDGAILSGGTAVGLPGVVGTVSARLGRRIVGYVPAGHGDPKLYGNLRGTDGGGGEFTEREPLAMWQDILGSGIPVKHVRLVVCPGGPITVGEILLARALGAGVAFIDPAGDARMPLEDVLPLGADDVLEPPIDAMTIRAFVMWSELDPDLCEPIAASLHTGYRRRQRNRKAAGDPALAPWEELVMTFRRSNLAQADDIPNKLALVGKCLARGGERLVLNHEQVELLAEVEHGRYNVERLFAGWQLGARRVERSATPHLRPWNELSEEAKDYDREAVMSIDPALAEIGWGVADL